MSEDPQFEIIEEGAENKPCEGCGEVHEAVSLKGEIKKNLRMFRVVSIGYFASLLAFAGCLYMLVGIWGTAAFAAFAAAYFCHGNMGRVSYILSGLDQAAVHFGAQQAAQEEGSGETGDTGQYL